MVLGGFKQLSSERGWSRSNGKRSHFTVPIVRRYARPYQNILPSRVSSCREWCKEQSGFGSQMIRRDNASDGHDKTYPTTTC